MAEGAPFSLRGKEDPWALRIHGAKGKGGKGPALSYRFVRKAKGWYLFVTVELPDAPIVTDRKRGAVGLDLNPGGIALVEVDRDGNPVHRTSFPLPLRGKTKGQSKALILEAAKAIVAHAKAVGKPIVVEGLDFGRKKAELRDRSLFCPWRPVGKRVGRREWTLKGLKGILRLITSPPPRKRRARRPRRRSHEGTEIAPRVLPWCGPPGPVVLAFTVGAGRASAVK
ncbi:hypothetical protein YIM1640_22590 [Thermus oshimai]